MKKFLAALLSASLLLSIAACGGGTTADSGNADTGADTSSDADAAADGAQEEKKQFVIGLSQEGLDHPFMTTQREQVIATAEAAGAKVIATDGQNNVVTQIKGIEDMLVQGIDILLLQVAQAEPLREVLKKCQDQGVPYMFVGKTMEDDGALTSVAIDGYDVGQQAGKFIVEFLKERYGEPKGNLVLMEGIPGDPTSATRLGGCTDYLKDYPDVKVVATVCGEYRRAKAVSAMQDVLQAHEPGTIDFVFAPSGDMALGVAQAAKDAGRLGEFGIAGMDGEKSEVEAIRNGEISVTWLAGPCGVEGTEIALKYLNGESVEKDYKLEAVQMDQTNCNDIEPAF